LRARKELAHNFVMQNLKMLILNSIFAPKRLVLYEIIRINSTFSIVSFCLFKTNKYSV